MRFMLAFALLTLLSGCVAMQPQQYQTVQTFTGPVAVPVQNSQPQPVTGGISGDNLGVGGWLRIVLGGNCYLVPTVNTGYGDGVQKRVRIQC